MNAATELLLIFGHGALPWGALAGPQQAGSAEISHALEEDQRVLTEKTTD